MFLRLAPGQISRQQPPTPTHYKYTLHSHTGLEWTIHPSMAYPPPSPGSDWAQLQVWLLSAFAARAGGFPLGGTKRSLGFPAGGGENLPEEAIPPAHVYNAQLVPAIPTQQQRRHILRITRTVIRGSGGRRRKSRGVRASIQPRFPRWGSSSPPTPHPPPQPPVPYPLASPQPPTDRSPRRNASGGGCAGSFARQRVVTSAGSAGETHRSASPQLCHSRAKRGMARARGPLRQRPAVRSTRSDRAWGGLFRMPLPKVSPDNNPDRPRCNPRAGQ